MTASEQVRAPLRILFSKALYTGKIPRVALEVPSVPDGYANSE